MEYRASYSSTRHLHSVAKDDEYGGYKVLKNSTIVTNIRFTSSCLLSIPSLTSKRSGPSIMTSHAWGLIHPSSIHPAICMILRFWPNPPPRQILQSMITLHLAQVAVFAQECMWQTAACFLQSPVCSEHSRLRKARQTRELWSYRTWRNNTWVFHWFRAV